VSTYGQQGLVATKQMKLFHKDSGKWWDVSAYTNQRHTKTYTWTRIGVDGKALDSKQKPFAIGKVCYADDTDVDRKCVFICEVSEGEVS
jgi:hypothetical protein